MKLFAILVSIAFTAFSFTNPTSERQRKELSEFKLKWDGHDRSYWVHFPPVRKMNKALPVLFSLHGGGGNAKQMSRFTNGRFNRLADRDGFIVVYPQGIDKSWNDGREDYNGLDRDERIDDVGFLVEIAEVISEKYKVDKLRIFTTGISNGGFMSSRLLCDRPDVFKGGAIVTATLSEDYLPSCNPSQATNVLVMNGTSDPLVPYDGGQIKAFHKNRGAIISTDDFVNFWRKKNRCEDLLGQKMFINELDDGTLILIEKYSNCNSGKQVALYKIEGGGHTWPRARQYLPERRIGKTSKEVNGCDVIWDFFSSVK